MEDKELIKIVNQAIPLRSCAFDRANDINRRVWLLQQVKKYVQKQLEGQFNAKEVA